MIALMMFVSDGSHWLICDGSDGSEAASGWSAFCGESLVLDWSGFGESESWLEVSPCSVDSP